MADLDESAIRAGHAQAVKDASAAPEGSAAKAIAMIELDTFSSLARAAGLTL
jgi:hypothetical protein